MEIQSSKEFYIINPKEIRCIKYYQNDGGHKYNPVDVYTYDEGENEGETVKMEKL